MEKIYAVANTLVRNEKINSVVVNTLIKEIRATTKKIAIIDFKLTAAKLYPDSYAPAEPVIIEIKARAKQPTTRTRCK